MMNLLLFILCLGVIYSYAIYPFLLNSLTKSAPFKPEEPVQWPSVSLIITAHNEEARIKDKLSNSLEIDYPHDHLELIVASDCSSDATDEIASTFDSRIKLVRADQHLGKEYAQLCAIQQASGEIIVFSDVATQIPGDAIKKMVSYFSDARVGAVSSEDRFISEEGKIAGEGAYVKYEMWLRSLESRLAGLVGLSGSFFACRKEVCEGWDTESPSDFNTALRTAKNGMVAISCPDVLGYYKDISDPDKEYQRKVRTVIRGITSIARHKEVLNINQYGLFSFQVWSHKVMRWAVPWFMLAVLLLSFFGSSAFAKLVFWLQVPVYLAAVIGWKMPQHRDNSAIKIIFFFFQVNIAIAEACIKFFTGTRMTVWTPSKR